MSEIKETAQPETTPSTNPPKTTPKVTPTPTNKATTPGSSSVFVGGVKACFTQLEIRKYFSQFGSVVSVKMKKSRKKKSINRGFCIVKFENPKSAKRVISIKHHMICQRKVTCREFLKGNELKKSKRHKNDRKIYINNLPKETTNGDIEALFSQFGAVESAYTLSDEITGYSKGFGFVTFEDKSTLERVFGASRELRIGTNSISVALFSVSEEEDEQAEKEMQGKEKQGDLDSLVPKKRSGPSKGWGAAGRGSSSMEMGLRGFGAHAGARDGNKGGSVLVKGPNDGFIAHKKEVVGLKGKFDLELENRVFGEEGVDEGVRLSSENQKMPEGGLKQKNVPHRPGARSSEEERSVVSQELIEGSDRPRRQSMRGEEGHPEDFYYDYGYEEEDEYEDEYEDDREYYYGGYDPERDWEEEEEDYEGYYDESEDDYFEVGPVRKYPPRRMREAKRRHESSRFGHLDHENRKKMTNFSENFISKNHQKKRFYGSRARPFMSEYEEYHYRGYRNRFRDLHHLRTLEFENRRKRKIRASKGRLLPRRTQMDHKMESGNPNRRFKIFKQENRPYPRDPYRRLRRPRNVAQYYPEDQFEDEEDEYYPEYEYEGDWEEYDENEFYGHYDDYEMHEGGRRAPREPRRQPGRDYEAYDDEFNDFDEFEDFDYRPGNVSYYRHSRRGGRGRGVGRGSAGWLRHQESRNLKIRPPGRRRKTIDRIDLREAWDTEDPLREAFESKRGQNKSTQRSNDQNQPKSYSRMINQNPDQLEPQEGEEEPERDQISIDTARALPINPENSYIFDIPENPEFFDSEEEQADIDFQGPQRIVHRLFDVPLSAIEGVPSNRFKKAKNAGIYQSLEWEPDLYPLLFNQKHNDKPTSVDCHSFHGRVGIKLRNEFERNYRLNDY